MVRGKTRVGKPYAGNSHMRFDDGKVASVAMLVRRSLNCKRMIAAVAMMAMASVFAVDKYYLKATETANTYSDVADFGFLNPQRWGLSSLTGDPADDFDSTADYIVRKNSLRLVVKGGTNKTFQGGRLVFGVTGSHGALLLYTTSPNVTTFGNNGLTLVHGCILCTSTKNCTYLTDGPINVATYSSGYTHISFNYDNNTLRHAGTLSVQSGKTLIVGGDNGFGGKDKLAGTFEVQGSCAGVEGTIQVVSQPFVQSETLTDDYDTTLGLGTTAIPGTVAIGANCRLRTLKGSDVLEIANLSFAANTWLDVPYDSANYSFGAVHVTGSLTVADKVTITAPAVVPRMAKAAVLTAPKSSGISEANFELADSANDPYRTLTVEEVGDDLVVYVTYADVPVYQKYGNCTLGVSEWWSDGLPSREGVNYVLDIGEITNTASEVALKMPNDVTSYAFSGDSLTLGDDCCFRWSRDTTTTPVFSCKLLRLLDGSSLIGGQKSPIKITGGVIDAVSGVVGVYGGQGRNIILDSEISGSAELRLLGYATGSESPYAAYTFNGLNTNFFGKVTVRQRLVTNDDKYTRNNYSEKHNSLTISNALSLGGKLPSLEPKALILAYYAPLNVKGDTTLAADSNRGIFIENTGRINVGASRNAPYTFRVETQLAINGTFWKEGVGTLDLAGTMAFGSDGAGSTPEAGANSFIVTGGVVRVSSADAINGAAVEFGPDTSMELAVDLSDAELTAYGIRNVKTDSPFTLTGGADKLPLTIRTDGVTPPDTVFSFALLTVSANAARDVRDMIPALSSPFRCYAVAPTEAVDPETGDVTFGLKFTYQGMKIILR